MRMASFTYEAPASIDELLRIFTANGGPKQTRLLAGGQSLIPLLARGGDQVERLIDLNHLDGEIGAISVDGMGLRIGAMVRQRTAERDPSVAMHCPLLAEALPLCARPAVRTRGTIGGSLAHADPAAEIPVIALALDAQFTAVGPGGSRTIAARDFFTGRFRTALAADEILTEMLIPALAESSGSSFIEISRRHSERAVVGVAANVALNGDLFSEVRVALANVGATPIRAERTESGLRGQVVSHEAIMTAAALVSEDIAPETDLHASAEYRRHVAAVLTRRAVTTAVKRVGACDD